MKRQRFFSLVATAATVGLLASANMTSAMQGELDFSEIRLEQPQNVKFNGSPNLRRLPDPDSQLLGVIPAGSVGQIDSVTNERSLVRATDSEGNYYWGWVNNDDARMTETEDGWALPTCEVSNSIPVDNNVMFGNYYLIDGFANDCDKAVEGRDRLIEEHDIFVLFDDGTANLTDTQNGVLVMREGTTWWINPEWNTSDFSTEKLPIVGELVSAKRANMLDENYDWRILVHLVNGDQMAFEAGEDVPVFTPDEDEYAPNLEPVRIPVAGVYQRNRFVASIGSTATQSVAMIDDKLYWFTGPEDNVEFLAIELWNIPSGWSINQIIDWAANEYPELTLEAMDGFTLPDIDTADKAAAKGGPKTPQTT